MIQNFRNFETGPDPFGRSWKVEFRWQQNAISIRHADAVDVKWVISSGDDKQEKVVALPHPALLALSKSMGRELTDGWCMKLAGRHLIQMIATWEDMDKTLVTVSAEQLRVAGQEQIAADAAA